MGNLGSKETMSKNIQRYLDKNGMNSKQLSIGIDTPYSTVRSWIQMDNYPRIDKIELMADFFGINKSDLVEEPDMLPDSVIPLEEIKKLPILGTVACGTPLFSEQNLNGYFITNDIIKADFCLYCKGDSMVDIDVNDGDLVFVKKTNYVDNGKVAVILIEDETTLKRVYKTDDSLILQAENKDYPPLICSAKDCEEKNIRILGEMIGIYKEFEQ